MVKEDEDDFLDEEATVYEDENQESLVEDDAVSAQEDGFMRGYDEVDEAEDEIDFEPDPE